MTTQSNSPAQSETVTYQADNAYSLTGADLLLAAVTADHQKMAAILDRTVGHHGTVIATTLQWAILAAARSLRFDDLGVLPGDSEHIPYRARRLVRALSRNAVVGVNVPRALRPSLALTAEAWSTRMWSLVLDTDDLEALMEVLQVCAEVAIAAAEQLDVTPEAYVAGAVRVATAEGMKALSAAIGDLS